MNTMEMVCVRIEYSFRVLTRCLRKVGLECCSLLKSDYFTGCYRILHVICKGELCVILSIRN